MEVINTELLRTMALPELDEQGRLKQAGTVLVLVGSPHLPGPAVLAARAVLRTGSAVYIAAPEGMALHVGLAVPEATPVAVGDSTMGPVEDVLKALRKQLPGWGATLVLARSNDLKAGANGAETVVHVTKQSVEVRLHTSNGPLDDAAWTILAQRQDAVLVALDKGAGRGGVYSSDSSFQSDEGPTGAYIPGSADVQAGIITALVARGLEPVPAAVWGLHLFRLALEAATKDFGDEGVLASDIIRYIPGSLRYARRTTGAKKETATAGFRRAN